MSQISGVLDYCIKGLIEYETQKVVQIHSKKIGITFRLIQLGIIMYVILWVMVYEKGYQSFDQAVSGVTAKLKGVAFANVTNNPEIGARVWDAGDYVIPPQQNSAFFVMTNVVYTSGQMLGVCEEAHDVLGNSCYNDSQCQAGHLVLRGSGIQTGRCVNSTRQANLSVCEIYGWCPTEHDIIPRPHLLGSAENFTVMIKNNIEFPRFRVKRRNILSWMSRLFLKTCLYNPNDKILKYCPIFRLGDILKYSGSVNKDIWETGGMVSIHIEWNCNLDFDEEYCLPKYIFRQFDDFQLNVAKGWNFRFSHHYLDGGKRKRNMIKAYGIQFFITVYGTGGKFDILTFSMNLGSGLALLGIATVLCDLIVLNITSKRSVYRKAKIDLIAEKIKLKQNEKINDVNNIKSNLSFSETSNSEKKSQLIVRRHLDELRTPETEYPPKLPTLNSSNHYNSLVLNETSENKSIDIISDRKLTTQFPSIQPSFLGLLSLWRENSPPRNSYSHNIMNITSSVHNNGNKVDSFLLPSISPIQLSSNDKYLSIP
ncbi:unnamed protein product [Heterobilharzia americana]|nr:unnamed protein product [Heterobilharzia americana]